MLIILSHVLPLPTPIDKELPTICTNQPGNGGFSSLLCLLNRDASIIECLGLFSYVLKLNSAEIKPLLS